MKSVLAICITLSLLVTGCNSSVAQKLAQASDAFAHALSTFQQGEQLAVQSGKISAAEDQNIQRYLIQAANAGMALDSAIRQNESQPSVAVQLNTVITTINNLIQQGVGNIKDAQTKNDLQVALTGAEAAISVVASVVGTLKTTAPPPTLAPAVKGAL